jgi:hypothetical protein
VTVGKGSLVSREAHCRMEENSALYASMEETLLKAPSLLVKSNQQ